MWMPNIFYKKNMTVFTYFSKVYLLYQDCVLSSVCFIPALQVYVSTTFLLVIVEI